MLLSGVVLFLLLDNVSARVNCTHGDIDFGDAYCVERYREGSICAQDGFCSNPFRSGCLHKVLDASGVEYGDVIPIRTCNTDDDEEAQQRGECLTGNYDEIRILSQDWEAPMLTAWIMQIVLSEVLGVPTTLETSMADSSMNFYDPQMRFAYSNDTYNYDALRTSMEHDGCESFRAEQEEKGWYRSCADVVTEAWNGQIENIEAMVQEGVIEPSTGSGGVAKFSWFIPKFTAERNYQLLSIYGLNQGTKREQRRRLAETFLRPRTWKYFCDEMSPDNCTTPYYDDEGRLIASRPPTVGEREEQEFFNAGNYHGHFSKTNDNDCDANPDNCTGHFANPPCVWTNYANAQVHHLGIPVWSDGTSTAGGHYKFWEMVGIYHAANYTKSNVLLYWYAPDTMIQEYIGTDAEFTPIYLPPSTIECRNNRVTEEQRCSDNREDWFGDEAGSCDSENFPVQRLIVANLYNRTYKDAMVDRSPAYKFLKAFRIGDLDLELIYRNWYAIQNDRWNYDHREAVCNWVGEHINMLTDFIPESYPRTTVYVEYDSVGLIIALVVAVITVLLVVASAALTYHYRKKRVMIYAQPIFLYLILSGVYFVSIGAILISLPPASRTCMVTEWFVTIGYSLILVPLIVKVSAINKLFKGAAKMKRVKITPADLYKKIGYIISGVVVFLIVWSSVDPFKDTKGRRLSGIDNSFGGEIVEVFDTCASNFAVWFILRFIYMVLLCVTATVLAVQTRKVKQEFNESVLLGHMIYAIFLIELILILIWLLSPKQLDIIQQEFAAATQSYVMSANSLAILFIYFYPKIDAARKNKGGEHSNISVPRFSNSKYSSTDYGVFIRESGSFQARQKGPNGRPNIVSGVSIGQELPQKEDPHESSALSEFQENETDMSKTLKTGCTSNPKSDAFLSTEIMPDNAEDETNEIGFSQEEA